MDEQTEIQVRDALSNLAGIDTHDVNLRDHPMAWEIMESLLEMPRVVRFVDEPTGAVLQAIERELSLMVTSGPTREGVMSEDGYPDGWIRRDHVYGVLQAAARGELK